MSSGQPSLASRPAPQAAILVERRSATGIVTLNRPDRINAIDDSIRTGLPEALLALEADPAIRCIVLRGCDGKGFCVGADIREVREAETALQLRDRYERGHWTHVFERITKPIIAAIHGFCLGGGLEMALCCDIRLASRCASFSLPETGLGLIPGAGGTQRLPRLIGYGRALDLMLTGDRIDADEAHRIGLVTRLAETPEALFAAALELADRIADRAPLATAYVKEAARKGADLTLADGLSLERSLFALLSETGDKAEAARAFVEKRKPVFRGE